MNIVSADDVEVWESFFVPYEMEQMRRVVFELRRPFLDRQAVLAMQWQPRFVTSLEIITNTVNVIIRSLFSFFGSFYYVLVNFVFQWLTELISLSRGGNIYLYQVGAVQRGYSSLTSLAKRKVVLDWEAGDYRNVISFLLEVGGYMEIDEEETIGPMLHH